MRVECPSCDEIFEADDGRAGQIIDCPTCGGQMQLPAVSTPPAPESPMPPGPEQQLSPDTALRSKDSTTVLPPDPVSGPPTEANRPQKACRFCGERILAVAQKCKHCGSFLSGTRVRGPGGRSGGDAEGSTSLICGIIGLVLVCFPLAPVILGGVAISNGIKSRRKNPANGTAIAGLVIGTIDLILGLMGLLWWLVVMIAGVADA